MAGDPVDSGRRRRRDPGTHVRLPVEESARPNYLTPLVRVTDPAVEGQQGWQPTSEWVVDDGLIDKAGQLLSDDEKGAIIRHVYDGAAAREGGAAVERYLADHGLRHYIEYHPGSRFLTLQLIEAAVFLGLATALITAAILLVRRRTA
ncbi:hypothetical protein [Nonomuraea sp. NPDC048916]|uniref:hypothetical protein n=1 Tax=Nonomuraea sp. NPDC048916 TaxID=3154232 RepID=UPI0033CBCEE4